MAIVSKGIEPHWNYFLALDADLNNLSRYIEFHRDNFDCYSIEIARLLLAAASEADVVCKQLCKKINPSSQAQNINAYRKEIYPLFPSIGTFRVLLPRFGLTLWPWERWRNPNKPPLWWTAYNKVKHQRNTQFHQANLKHTLNSVAGLFVIVLYLNREKAMDGELIPAPQVLHVSAQHHGGMIVGGYEPGISYVFEKTVVGKNLIEYHVFAPGKVATVMPSFASVAAG
jgi:hypothetical protein